MLRLRRPLTGGKADGRAKSVAINGLPLIFAHLQKKGLRPGNDCADALMETVRIYHPIDASEETAYRGALAAAYETYCRRQSN